MRYSIDLRKLDPEKNYESQYVSRGLTHHWSVNVYTDGENPLNAELRAGYSPSDRHAIADAMKAMDWMTDLDLCPPVESDTLRAIEAQTQERLESERRMGGYRLDNMVKERDTLQAQFNSMHANYLSMQENFASAMARVGELEDQITTLVGPHEPIEERAPEAVVMVEAAPADVEGVPV